VCKSTYSLNICTWDVNSGKHAFRPILAGYAAIQFIGIQVRTSSYCAQLFSFACGTQWLLQLFSRSCNLSSKTTPELVLNTSSCLLILFMNKNPSFEINILICTLSRGGDLKKCTLCTLVKMLIIVNHVLGFLEDKYITLGESGHSWMKTSFWDFRIPVLTDISFLFLSERSTLLRIFNQVIQLWSSHNILVIIKHNKPVKLDMKPSVGQTRTSGSHCSSAHHVVSSQTAQLPCRVGAENHPGLHEPRVPGPTCGESWPRLPFCQAVQQSEVLVVGTELLEGSYRSHGVLDLQEWKITCVKPL
jgi:hypothetical protein